jgi:hypothetical protein
MRSLLSKFCSQHCPTLLRVGGILAGSVALTASAANVPSLWPGAIVARDSVTMEGGIVDSFDSTSLFKSWYGRYRASWFVGDNCWVASTGNNLRTITLSNANVYGRVATGPRGTMTLNSNAGVGSHAWQLANPGAIEPNDAQRQWYSHDADTTFPTIALPFLEGLSPSGPMDVAVVGVEVTASGVTSTNYPAPPPPPPSQVMTNTTAYVTNSNYPGPWPYMVTNSTLVTNATYPSPVPPGGVGTNYLGQFSAAGASLPTPGTYVPGTLITNNNNGTKSYAWKGFSSKSYTYAVPIYVYPVFTYTYAVFTTNAFCLTNHYDRVLSNGDFVVENPEQFSGATVVLGRARLVWPNGLHMSGSDSIVIAEGSSLRVFAGGTNCTVAGNGIINQNGSAKSLTISCLPSVTTFDFNGNGEFAGIIVAPEAKLTLGNVGHAQNDFIGAMMAREVVVEEGYLIHFDESLISTNLVRLTTAVSGERRVQVPGMPGFTSVLECSSNFIDWMPVATNDGPFEFVDADSGAAPARFNRSVQQ